MAHFIDRRLNGKNKSTVNRQRFIRRYKQQIKQAVSDAVTKRSILDVDKGEQITIPTKDLGEPLFGQGGGGRREQVFPGNDQFSAGDQIERPKNSDQGAAGEGGAADQSEGSDEFSFQISKDEYLDLLFEDLALPRLAKTERHQLLEMKTYRAGYSAHGVPANINIVRSLQNSLARRMAMQAGKKRARQALLDELKELKQAPTLYFARIAQIEKEIRVLDTRIQAVPFIDTFDLKFNNFQKRAVPSSQAVMFCLMDVSGSMDQATKEMAKRFYILLYLFLSRTYKNVEVVYIRHHTQAKEVDEQTFFYSQETGGTIVSSALKLMHEIMAKRYSDGAWNIYAAQASDGDNWADDSPTCRELLARQLLPKARYFAYIEITNRAHQTLWHEYQTLQQTQPHFAMAHIKGVSDIYPVFRELFKKQVN
ncbi:MAG: YeaH/YhbH family protein [Aeromonas sp.]